MALLMNIVSVPPLNQSRLYIVDCATVMIASCIFGLSLSLCVHLIVFAKYQIQGETSRIYTEWNGMVVSEW